MNPETIFSDKPNLIDLTKLVNPPDIRADKMPDGWYWATDRASFNPDPSSRWNIIGRGKTKREAYYELLERLTEASQRPAEQYERIDCGPFEPAELRKLPAEYPDDE